MKRMRIKPVTDTSVVGMSSPSSFTPTLDSSLSCLLQKSKAEKIRNRKRKEPEEDEKNEKEEEKRGESSYVLVST